MTRFIKIDPRRSTKEAQQALGFLAAMHSPQGARNLDAGRMLIRNLLASEGMQPSERFDRALLPFPARALAGAAIDVIVSLEPETRPTRRRRLVRRVEGLFLACCKIIERASGHE